MAKTSHKPAPKRDRARTEAAILDSARILFSKKGFDATTTKEIAAKAKINEQLIQRYFGGKEGLLLQIIRNFQRCYLGRDTMDEIAGVDLRDELEKLFLYLMDRFEKQGEIFRVGISQAILNPKMGEKLSKKIREERLPDRIAKVEGYKKKGWVRSDLDTWGVAYGMMLMAFGIAFTGPYLHRMPKEKLRELAKVMADVWAKGLS
jgi:AcrR family transcriptional regulator